MFQYTVCITGFDYLSCKNTLFTFNTQTNNVDLFMASLLHSTVNLKLQFTISLSLFPTHGGISYNTPTKFLPPFQITSSTNEILMPLQSLCRNDYHYNSIAAVVAWQDRRSFLHIGSTAPS